MRKFITVTEYVPALVFAGLAAMVLSRLAIGLFPTEPAAWSAFLFFAAPYREISAFISAVPLDSALAAAASFALAIAAFAVAGKCDWLRSRFVLCHAALLLLFAAMKPPQIFSASTEAVSGIAEWHMPDLHTMQPMAAAALVLALVSCLCVHQDIISGIRKPAPAAN